MAFEGHLKTQQVRSCCTSELRKSFLPVRNAESCPHAAIFCVLPFPSTHTSSREMATNYRSCCSGGRDTRTAPSWATRPWQWESLTWLRYRVLGTRGESHMPFLCQHWAGNWAGRQGLIAVTVLACWLAIVLRGWAASCRCVNVNVPYQRACLSVCLGHAAPNGWWAAPGPPQQHEGCEHSSG